MTGAEALGRLRALGVPVVTNAQAATVWGQSVSATTHTLLRLAHAGLVQRIRHGLWATEEISDPLALASALTQPYPCYGSTWTALARHGMIEQIPRAISVVSLGRSQTIETSAGSFVIHHIHPDLYGGMVGDARSLLATPEKALFDTAYLLGVRGQGRVALPELTLPDGFDDNAVHNWVERVPSLSLRTFTRNQVERLLKGAEREEPTPVYRVSNLRQV